MLLKSLDLQGYKTFAGKTNFFFADAVTCIVGPNGSGKSNIADAIRWVLGEQSFSLLRGKKTVDMIFAGSELRPRASMASASIVFDNETGWLPIDFAEVSITRRAYRDGNNEYLLNGQRVRLKDIAELLGNSGLSERTYTIIGQGLVDATLALRADERRLLFEEAAGIGLYRSRRSEAQRRLETTFRNLERVEDILAELKPRLRSLERQSRRAERYHQVKEDLQVLLRDYYGYHWYRAQHELTEARENAHVQESMLDAVRQEQDGLDRQLTSYRDNIQSLRARLSSWLREMSNLHTQRETITRDLAVTDERIRSLTAQRQTAGEEVARLEAQLESQNEKATSADQEVDRLTKELAEAQSQVEKAQTTLQSLRTKREQAEREAGKIRKTITDQSNQRTRLQTRLAEFEQRLERQQEALRQTVSQVSQAEATLETFETRLQSAKKALDEIQVLRDQADEKLREHQEMIKRVEEEEKALTDQRNEKRTALAGLQAQLDVISQAEQAFAGYSNGAQLLLKAAGQNRLQGAQGALSSQLDVPEHVESAIAAALGEYLDAVLLESDPTSETALDILREDRTRGALLPLSALTPPEPIALPDLGGIVGLAADLVKAPPKLRPAIDLLLGHTIVVENRKTAREVLIGLPLQARAVTLSGEVFNANGPIFAGGGRGASTLSRPRQKRELQKQVQQSEKRIATLDGQIRELEQKRLEEYEKETMLVDACEQLRRQVGAADTAHSQVGVEAEKAARQAQWQRDRRDQHEAEIQQGQHEVKKLSESLAELETKIAKDQQELREKQAALAELSVDDLRTQLTHWRTQAAVAKQALIDARERQREYKSVATRENQACEQLRRRMTSMAKNLEDLERHTQDLRGQEGGIVEKIDQLQALIDPAEAELSTEEKARDGLRDAEGKARQALNTAERRNAQVQLDLSRKQERLDMLRERIEDDFGLVAFEYADDVSGPTPLPLGEMVEQLPMIEALPEGLDETIKRQRAQLRRMGAINPEAQSEYIEVKDRYEFMTEQVSDLQKAEEDIREVIAELDILMEREFRKTFDAVAAEFREVFTRLFGGGTARLLLTDPDDLTETGIEIEARLPGRRTQGLSLLSGGERSLTATALVFSLLKVSPTPFCVLDEVDAMLDEANVGRFRDLLTELAENTQFIVITHNRNTVQAAEVIYGVTMGRDSASQVISLKLDEVDSVVK